MSDLFIAKNRKYFEESLQTGKACEEFVAQLIESKCGGKCTPSETSEDKFSHIDFWWDSPKMGRIGIDVKGRNKDRRKDEDFSDNHWIEARNVSGNRGWIYGDMTYVAFRTKDKILFVKPQKLINIYEQQLMSQKPQTYTPSKPYILYTRSYFGNDDLAWKMPDDDLLKESQFYIDLINDEVVITESNKGE